MAYTLTARHELKIDYTATTDRDTVVNLTNHSYFNLAGQGEGDVLGHQVMIAAGRFTQRLPAAGNDELSHVAADFNRMAVELDSLYRELEAKVDAKSVPTWKTSRKQFVEDDMRQLQAWES